MMFSISNPLTAIVARYYTDELIMYCNNTKLEAEGVTYGEVKYTGGEASIIKINNGEPSKKLLLHATERLML